MVVISFLYQRRQNAITNLFWCTTLKSCHSWILELWRVTRTASRSSPILFVLCRELELPCMEVGSMIGCSDRFAVLAHPLRSMEWFWIAMRGGWIYDWLLGPLRGPRISTFFYVVILGCHAWRLDIWWVAWTALRSSPIHLVLWGDFGLLCIKVGSIRHCSDRFAVLAHPPRSMWWFSVAMHESWLYKGLLGPLRGPRPSTSFYVVFLGLFLLVCHAFLDQKPLNPNHLQSWVVTRCVVILGLLCDD